MRLRDISVRFDFYLFFAMLLLVAIGCLMIYSATYGHDSLGPLYARQLFYAFIGLTLIALIMGVNYQLFYDYAGWIYFFSLSLLILVLFLGKSVRGSRSWLPIGAFTVQPSEFAKIPVIIVLARYFSNHPEAGRRISGLAGPFFLAFVPMALILLQPDPGSALVFGVIFLGMLFLAGTRVIYLASFLIMGVLSVGIPLLLSLTGDKHPFLSHTFGNLRFTAIFLVAGVLGIGLIIYVLTRLKFRLGVRHFLFSSLVFVTGIMGSYAVRVFLKEYQKMRLISFLKPSVDPLGAGYHIIQSQISIGSGGFWGKGLFSGTQGKLGFLPAQHTDFIFSLLSEELGFVGASLLIILFLIVFTRGIRIALMARNRFGSLVAGGISCLILFQFVINLGMNMGVMPITGLPLPFVSYGGSALVTFMSCIGIVLNIYNRRFLYY